MAGTVRGRESCVYTARQPTTNNTWYDTAALPITTATNTAVLDECGKTLTAAQCQLQTHDRSK